MKKKYTLIRMMLLLALLVAGLTVAAVPGSAQSTITSATLWIYGEWSSDTLAQIRVHQIYYDWVENLVTWNNFYANPAPQYDPVPAGSFTSGFGWLSVDVTSLVQAWASGTPNYGMLLEQDLTGFTMCSSREGTMPPYLVICTDGVCDTTLYPVADARITQLWPDDNFNTTVLHIGRVYGYQKQSLIRFELPYIPPPCEGCTPGYWKNHLDAWPATGYAPGDDFDATFEVDYFNPNITLQQAVNLGGGGYNALARHGTAALLSAAHPDVDYLYTVREVIALVQAGDKDALEAANELGCPLD